MIFLIVLGISCIMGSLSLSSLLQLQHMREELQHRLVLARRRVLLEALIPHCVAFYRSDATIPEQLAQSGNACRERSFAMIAGAGQGDRIRYCYTKQSHDQVQVRIEIVSRDTAAFVYNFVFAVY